MLMALWLDVGLALGRADVDAHAAAGAVVGRDLDGEPVVRQVARLELLVTEAGRARRRRPSVGKTFIRIVACGQTIAHLPQSMQIVGSQIGICWAIARFSYFVVPVGNVPSTGRALTGSRSPSPAISRAVTRATKSGTSSGTSARHRQRVADRRRAARGRARASERSIAAKLRCDDGVAALARRSSRRTP